MCEQNRIWKSNQIHYNRKSSKKSCGFQCSHRAVTKRRPGKPTISIVGGVKEVITNDSGVQTTTRDFDTMDVDSLYIETVSEDGADDIVYHKRVSDNKTTYYFGQGSEVSTEYDEHGNMTKQQGKDATMGNFEQTFENTYDDNGNLVSMKSTYNGDDGYFIDYIYAALNDASYNGEGTLLFDAATDTPSAA